LQYIYYLSKKLKIIFAIKTYRHALASKADVDGARREINA